jgi:hypothetical protein
LAAGTLAAIPSNQTRIMSTATPPNPQIAELLALIPEEERRPAEEQNVQAISKKFICRTDYRPQRRSPLRLIVDATDGFVPLWARDQVLRWRFNRASVSVLRNATEVMERVRNVFTAAISAWGDAVPIRFVEEVDNSDFEISIERNEDCNVQGCTLAQAFFPDAGRHQLYIFPTMFGQPESEQVETLAHEIGHVFGLRHYFALTDEREWPAELFGRHERFSIMNYNEYSRLTDTDRSDLKALYEGAWSGRLTSINRTPIRLVKPFHTMGV